MAVVILNGKIAGEVAVGEEGGIPFKKFKLCVENYKGEKSYFAVIFKGDKVKSTVLAAGKYVTIEGTCKKEKFTNSHLREGGMALVVTTYYVKTHKYNVRGSAKIYNLLATMGDNEPMVKNGENYSIYSQTVRERHSNICFTPYNIKYFNKKGENLYKAGLLSGSNVNRVSLSGNIETFYQEKDDKKFLIITVYPEFYEIIDFVKQEDKNEELGIDEEKIPF